MPDRLTAAQRSVNMSKIRSKDTKPEIVVRRLLHGMGYRYRLHRKDLPGKPDLVFGPRQKVIFVHGCFWHQHDRVECQDGRKPTSNREYWSPKLDRNVERDSRHVEALKALGWKVLVIWECETTQLDVLADRVAEFLSPAGGD